MTVYAKDPDAVLDYRWDMSDWLTVGDTIDDADVTVASGDVVLDSQAHDATSVTAWVSGGTRGTGATLTAHVVTTQGRTDDRTLYLRVTDR